MLTKKMYRRMLFTIALLIIVSSMFAIYYSQNTKQSKDTRGITESKYAYYIKEYEDKIGVYKPEGDEPFMIIDVFINTLPNLDQVHIKEGIAVKDDKKLRQMIEDYES